MGWYIGGRPAPRIRDMIFRGRSSLEAYPLDQESCSLFFSGRYALAGAFAALGFTPGERVLVPSYNCGVELDPIAFHKLEPIFYNIRKDFRVDLDDLAAKCKGGPKGVLITHFLGFPQPMEEIEEILEAMGVLCIEDCAHAFLSCYEDRPLGSFGDASVFSLLKSLPVATGGVLVLKGDRSVFRGSVRPPRGFPSWLYLTELTRKRSYDDTGTRRNVFPRLAAAGLHLALQGVGKGIAGVRKLSGRGGEFLVRPDGFSFEEHLANQGVSHLCSRIVSNTDFQEVKRIRRRNYAYLLEHFKGNEAPNLPLEDLPDGVCPLFFPIIVENKEVRQELYRRLGSRGVVTHPWWDQFRTGVPWDQFPDAVYLKERVFGLPIHQDLGKREMDRVLEEFHMACRGLVREPCPV